MPRNNSKYTGVQREDGQIQFGSKYLSVANG